MGPFTLVAHLPLLLKLTIRSLKSFVVLVNHFPDGFCKKKKHDKKSAVGSTFRWLAVHVNTSSPVCFPADFKNSWSFTFYVFIHIYSPRVFLPLLWKTPGFGRWVRHQTLLPPFWRVPFIARFADSRWLASPSIHAFGPDNAAYITLHMFPFCTSTIHFITGGEGVLFLWRGWGYFVLLGAETIAF